MATGVIGFPSTGPGNDQGDMSPLFTREQAGHPDLNAPTNPYANRQDVRRMILERMGGRDPFSYDYIGQAQQSVYNNLPELFAYAFRGTNITYDQLLNGTISPRAKAHWNKVVSEFIRSEQAAAADQQRRDMQLYTKMAQEFEQDRRQYNADYWRANPTEAQIRQVQMGVMKEAERMTGEQLKKLPKDINGNPAKPGVDAQGNPTLIPLSPQEIEGFMARQMERNIEQIAKYTGTMKYMPKSMRDHFALKEQARNATLELSKDWSEGKMPVRELYDRINSISDARIREMIAENIRGSGDEGKKLYDAIRQYGIDIKNGKEEGSPFGSITTKNIKDLEKIIEDQKPSLRKSAYRGIQGISEALLGLKKPEPAKENIFGYGATGEPVFTGRGAEAAPPAGGKPGETKGFWQSIKDIFGGAGPSATQGIDQTTRDIAARGAGPEAMGVLEAGWNLAKEMFAPREAAADEFNPAVMLREPSMPEPIGIAAGEPGGFRQMPGGWQSQMNTLQGYQNPYPETSFVPAGGPADVPVFNRYNDASDILFGG